MSRKESQVNIHQDLIDKSDPIRPDSSLDLANEDGFLEFGDDPEEKALSQKELDLLAVKEEGYTAVDRLVDPDNHHRLSGWYEAGIKLVHDIHVINRKNYDLDVEENDQKGFPEKLKGGLKKVPGVKRFVGDKDVESDGIIFENNGNGHIPGK